LDQRPGRRNEPHHQFNRQDMSKLLSLYIAVTVTGLTAIAAVCWLLLIS
jgi:hypothetical protein